jgi:hypothetical protein
MAKELIQLAIDAYQGSTGEFSQADANETLRRQLVELVGTDKPGYKDFRKNGAAVFEILEVAINKIIVDGLNNQFDSFVEIRNLALGDENRFTVSMPDLFKVATVADGFGTIRRQRLDKGSFSVSLGYKGIAIYEEFTRFLSGRIDWVEMVNRVGRSWTQDMKTNIMNAVMDSYSQLTTTYNVTNSGAFDAQKMINLVAHVEAGTGVNAQIWGTKAALAKVIPGYYSDLMKDDRNARGFFANFNGTPLFEITQAHKPGTDTFAIKDDTLLVLPAGGERLVKMVIEGESTILQNGGGLDSARADGQMEYTFIHNYGLSVLSSRKYGMYRIV